MRGRLAMLALGGLFMSGVLSGRVPGPDESRSFEGWREPPRLAVDQERIVQAAATLTASRLFRARGEQLAALGQARESSDQAQSAHGLPDLPVILAAARVDGRLEIIVRGADGSVASLEPGAPVPAGWAIDEADLDEVRFRSGDETRLQRVFPRPEGESEND